MYIILIHVFILFQAVSVFLSASISLVPLVDCSECVGHHDMTEVCLCVACSEYTVSHTARYIHTYIGGSRTP